MYYKFEINVREFFSSKSHGLLEFKYKFNQFEINLLWNKLCKISCHNKNSVIIINDIAILMNLHKNKKVDVLNV